MGFRKRVAENLFIYTHGKRVAENLCLYTGPDRSMARILRLANANVYFFLFLFYTQGRLGVWHGFCVWRMQMVALLSDCRSLTESANLSEPRGRSSRAAVHSNFRRKGRSTTCAASSGQRTKSAWPKWMSLQKLANTRSKAHTQTHTHTHTHTHSLSLSLSLFLSLSLSLSLRYRYIYRLHAMHALATH